MKGRISETKCIMYLSRLLNGMSTVKNKPLISFAKFVVSITSIISSKKGNYFWSHYFGKVVIFGGSLLLAFANTCESSLLLSDGSFFREGGGGRYYRYLTVQDVHSIYELEINEILNKSRVRDRISDLEPWGYNKNPPIRTQIVPTKPKYVLTEMVFSGSLGYVGS